MLTQISQCIELELAFYESQQEVLNPETTTTHKKRAKPKQMTSMLVKEEPIILDTSLEE
jgi:hypothetical protein